MIKITNLNKSYGKKSVLENLNCNIKTNSIYGLIGANGAGKSTLLRIINDIFKRDSGSIEQDADVIMFLHRDRVETNSQEEKPQVIPTELILSKQRNGPTGTAKISFIPRYAKFENNAIE